MLVTCFANSTGFRIGSFSTEVENFSFVVTAAIQAVMMNGVDKRHAVEEFARSVVIIGIFGIGVLGIADAVRQGEGIEPRSLGRLRQLTVKSRIAHRRVIAEPHQDPPEYCRGQKAAKGGLIQ